jgi:hypothetical protein
MQNQGKGALAGTAAGTKLLGGTVDTLTGITNDVDVVLKTAAGDNATDDTADAVKALLVDSTGSAISTNSEGRIDVVTHAHPNHGHAGFESDIAATADFILIDLSDTTNYPHTLTSYIHLENIFVIVDATADADYTVQIGWVENVDATNGDFYEIYHFGGTKKLGNSFVFDINHAPNAPSLISTNSVGTNTSANDTAFQTDVSLGSTLAPGTTNTPSGDGDMVMRVTMNAGTIGLTVGVGYHTH